MNNECCGECKFALEKTRPVVEVNLSPTMIFCRRYPPAIKQGFPVVAKEDWCGEFCRREEVLLEESVD